jgi:copper oxidase (laccase) domain-containing protein
LIVRSRKTSLSKGRNRQPVQTALSPAKIAAPWMLRKSDGLQVLQLAPFAKLPWLVHGFSTRAGGTSTLDGETFLNLSFTEWDAKENVVENRRQLQAAVGANDFTLVAMRQIHSDVIRPFATPPAGPCKGDASTTKEPGLLLGTQSADCVPILLVDPKKRAVAAIHAGWRGCAHRAENRGTDAV